MPRTARIVIPGTPHHITHRGNNREAVFLDEHDFFHYGSLLLKHARAESMRVLGYCLMPNHVHIVSIPSTEDTLERVFRETQRRYASHFNRKYNRSGHLWQNRFFSCPMDEQHTLNALAYVELNPVRAGLAGAAEHYLWSSAPAHFAQGYSDPLLNLERWFSYWTAEEWQAKLNQIAEDRGFGDAFRRCTQKGLPLGDAAFRMKVHQQLRATRRETGLS